MKNSWLEIALSDYEGHMGADAVGQLAALSELFRDALEWCKPKSVAICGVAGGNGLERVDCAVTKRIVGLDINPKFLEAVRVRYGALPGLELHCVDLVEQSPGITGVELVHAALIFEHTGLLHCLENTLSLLALEGKFSVVLQLPSATEKNVTPTRFTAIESLERSFRIVDVADFVRVMEENRFALLQEDRRNLPRGKGLWMGIFAQTTR